MRHRKLSFGLVFSSFFEQLAWAPLLVVLATAAGDPEAVALAASAYSLANLAGNLVFGMLSDRIGRYRVAGAGLLGMAGTALLHVGAGSPAALVGARLLHGLTAAAVAPAALAVVSDGVPGNRRGETMARAGLVIALASMLAPALSGRVAKAAGAEQTVLILAAGLAVMGAITLAAGRGQTAPWRRVQRQADPAGEGRINPLLTLVVGVVAFVVMFGQNVLFYALPLQGARLGMGPAQVGGLLSAFAVGAVVAFVPPLSKLADRWGRGAPMTAGLLLSGLGLLILAGAAAAGPIAAGLLVYGLGFGLAFPAVTALSADAAGQGRRGMAFGVLTAAFSAGAVVGPLVTRGLSELASPFTVAAAVALAGVVITLLGVRQGRPAAEVPHA